MIYRCNAICQGEEGTAEHYCIFLYMENNIQGLRISRGCPTNYLFRNLDAIAEKLCNSDRNYAWRSSEFRRASGIAAVTKVFEGQHGMTEGMILEEYQFPSVPRRGGFGFIGSDDNVFFYDKRLLQN